MHSHDHPMSHVSLPRLGHLAVDNNYGSPTSLSPVETSGTDEDDTSGNSTPDQNALETSGEAVVVSVATTPQKAGSAVVELTPIQGPLESTVKTDNDAVLVSVKRKHLAGKPHFQEVSTTPDDRSFPTSSVLFSLWFSHILWFLSQVIVLTPCF